MSVIISTAGEDVGGSLAQQGEPEVYSEPPSPTSKSYKIKKPSPIYVLLLGPTGSGKSSVINAVCDEQTQVAAPGSGICTTRFRYYELSLGDYVVNLIDSPGLGGPSTNNSKMLSAMVYYLMNAHYRPRRLSGIVYLHPEGSDLECDSLKNNINVLKIILGDDWLSRLKIAVVPKQDKAALNSDSISSLQDPSSPFHAVHMGGAEILPLLIQPENIRDILANYVSLPGQFLAIQSQILDGKIRNAGRYIDGILQPIPPERSPRSRRSVNQHSSRSVRTDLTDAVERSQHLERALAEYETEIKSLRDQLEQTRSDYASLRSELQLNDNMEQNKLVQSLNALNRKIEDFGRHIAEYIIDKHVVPYTDDHTALKSFDLPQMKILFRHSEGNSSLVMSSSGKGMQTEDFFDLAVRSMICKRLYEDVFLPFHPGLLDNPSNNFVKNLYETIRRQEHPNIAYKWRANAFLGICEGNDTAMQIKLLHERIERNIIQDLNQIFSSFLDSQTTVDLPSDMKEELNAVVALAWDWNYTLKGGVVVLGDFQPIICDYAVPFDPSCMVDFEPDRKKAAPRSALCAAGLGLTVFRSKTKGSPLEEVVVCKTPVVTEHIYE